MPNELCARGDGKGKAFPFTCNEFTMRSRDTADHRCRSHGFAASYKTGVRGKLIIGQSLGGRAYGQASK